MINNRDFFFSSTTRSTFIKTVVISYWKQLNLPINNEKLMNLEDLSSLLLLTWILSSALSCTTSHVIFYLCFIFCVLHLASFLILSLVRFPFSLRYNRFTRFSLYIISLDKQLYVKLVANQYKCFIWRRWVSCALHLLLCLLSHLLSSFCSLLGAVNLLVFLFTL